MKRRFRFTTPWYYTPSFGGWLLGYWNHTDMSHYKEWGIRVLGFEYWVEYWK